MSIDITYECTNTSFDFKKPKRATICGGVNGKMALVCASEDLVSHASLAELGATVWVNGRQSQGVDEAGMASVTPPS